MARRSRQRRNCKASSSGLDVGKTYNMTVLRDGKQMTIPVTVETLPNDTAVATRDDEDNGATKEKTRDSVAVSDLGVEVSALTPDAAKELKMENAKGVVLSSVKQGSLADDAGLHEGMVIDRINKHAVTTPEEFRDAMKNASLSKGVIFNVRTPDGSSRLVAIRKG